MWILYCMMAMLVERGLRPCAVVAVMLVAAAAAAASQDLAAAAAAQGMAPSRRRRRPCAQQRRRACEHVYRVCRMAVPLLAAACTILLHASLHDLFPRRNDVAFSPYWPPVRNVNPTIINVCGYNTFACLPASLSLEVRAGVAPITPT